MSESAGPVPQRIGDAERDRALDLLREHLAAGRIDQAEFDERASTALKARTAVDLAPLFADLPGPKPVGPPGTVAGQSWPLAQEPTTPGTEVAARPVAAVPSPQRSRAATVMSVVAGAAWPVTFLLLFAFDLWPQVWWAIWVPITLSVIAGKLRGDKVEGAKEGR